MRILNFIIISIFFLLYGFLNLSQAQWVLDTSILRNRVVTSFVSNEKYSFAATQGDGVYRSVKNSDIWIRISENFVIDDLNIRSIAVNGNFVYAGTEGFGLYVSKDNGNNWSTSNLINQTVNSIFIKGNYVFAGLAQNKGVYRSNNNGKTFDPANSGLGNLTIYSLVANDKYLFTGTGNHGVFCSSNDGDTWFNADLGNNALAVFSMAVNKNYVYAGTEVNGLYFSPDSGNTWKKSEFDPKRTIYSFAFKDCYMFTGTYQKGICVLDKNGELIGQDYYDDPHGSSVKSLWLLKDYIFAGTWAGVYKRKLMGPYSN